MQRSEALPPHVMQPAVLASLRLAQRWWSGPGAASCLLPGPQWRGLRAPGQARTLDRGLCRGSAGGFWRRHPVTCLAWPGLLGFSVAAPRPCDHSLPARADRASVMKAQRGSVTSTARPWPLCPRAVQPEARSRWTVSGSHNRH